MTDLTGIYVHIPFCRQKCFYCDFPSYAGLDSVFNDYAAALRREIDRRSGLLSSCRIDTIYFGGGTPTLLSNHAILFILETLQRRFTVLKDAEISIEANPGTIDTEKLRSLRSAGFNRISFGVQSFSDPVLQSAGRIHTAQQAVQSVMEAQDAGFDNVSVDLMYGLPGQTQKDVLSSFQQAIRLQVSHISVYGLKVEEGTPLEAALNSGRAALPDEDDELAMYEMATRILPENGYFRYEISNYARLGSQSRHNLKYWRYLPYIGFGAAACSFLDNDRLTNTPDVMDYIAMVNANGDPVTVRERIEAGTAMAEYAFLALRTVQGICFADFSHRFQVEFESHYAEQIDHLLHQQLICKFPGGIRLTELGMKFGNLVFAAFLPKKDK
ncbi:MAG: radical SAM family heme chaperone HemW [Negativicutes bacterium]